MFKNTKTQHKIPVIIDCDTGIDDAVSLMWAVKSEKFDIKLIVTDVGNVSPKQAAKNTLDVLELIGAPDIPVAAGDGKCFKQERPRYSAHGKTGLGEYVFEDHSRRALKVNAVKAIYDVLSNSTEKITIISLSPITNIAKLISEYPEASKNIEKIVFMAGSIGLTKRGEMPYPEFNVSCDPEATEVVLKSKIPLEIVPMEMGHTGYLSWQDVFRTKNTNFVGSVFEQIFRSYKDRHVKNGVAMHDACAVAYLTNPELFKVSPVHAEVKYYDSIGSGVMVLKFLKKNNAITCTEIDTKKFTKIYFKLLKKCK